MSSPLFTRRSHRRSKPVGIQLAFTGGVFCIIAIAIAVFTFLSSSSYQLQQRFFTAPPCAPGVIHSSSCIATVQGTVVHDYLSQQCTSSTSPSPYTNTCTPYLNATFAIPPHISASTTIDLQFIGNVAWSPGTPAVIQIWNNTITAVQVNGQVLHTTSYPTGTAGEQSLYGFAIGFFILGGLVILYGLIKVRFAKRAQLPDINDNNGIPPLPY